MSKAIQELRQTIARLRAPGGCPWDREQTHQSLTRCLIDECSELLETIDQLDMPHMREELGDVLIQVIFHAQLAEESGHFDLDDVDEATAATNPAVLKLETAEADELARRAATRAPAKAGAVMPEPSPDREPVLAGSHKVVK